MSEPVTALWPTPQTSNRKSRRAMRPHALGGESSPPGLEQAVELSIGLMPAEVYVPPVSSQLTLFVEAFPVSRTPWLAAVPAPTTTAISGPSSLDSFASCNPDGSWRKTCQGYSQVMLDGSLAAFSETWPRAGTTRNGTAYRRPPLAPLTDATASGWLPTPSAESYGTNQGGSAGRVGPIRPSLETMARQNLWPTPCAEDAKNVPYQKGDHGKRYPMLLGAVDPARMWPTPKSSTSGPDYARRERDGSGGDDLATAIGGSLNPTWVEWLIGYPLGWTVCAAWATRSSRTSPNGSPGASLRPRAHER